MAAGNIKEIEEFQTAQMNYQLGQKALNSDIALLSLERDCGDIEDPEDFKNQLKEIKLRSKSLREDFNKRTALHEENMSKYQEMVKQKVYVKQETNKKVKKEILPTVRKTLFEGTSLHTSKESPAVNDITRLSDSVSISNSSSSSPFV
jgi:hypothetical protein